MTLIRKVRCDDCGREEDGNTVDWLTYRPRGSTVPRHRCPACLNPPAQLDLEMAADG